MANDSPPPHEFEDIAAGESGGSHQTTTSGHTDEVIEDLSQRLREEQDGRREERFIFVLVALVLVNAHMLSSAETWTTPVLLGLLQLIGIVIYARRCGVEEVEKLIDKFLSAAPSRRE